jgi:ABC-type maltose transport system permease subunit
VAITLVLAVPATYSLARLTGHWGEYSSIAIFLVYLIPPTLLFIPLCEVVTLPGPANTVWSLVLVYPTIAVPFCTWLLLRYFRWTPREIEEAALTDGWSRVGAFFRVALPLAIPLTRTPDRLSHVAFQYGCPREARRLGPVRSSHAGCVPWVSGTNPLHRPHLGRMALSDG